MAHPQRWLVYLSAATAFIGMMILADIKYENTFHFSLNDKIDVYAERLTQATLDPLVTKDHIIQLASSSLKEWDGTFLIANHLLITLALLNLMSVILLVFYLLLPKQSWPRLRRIFGRSGSEVVADSNSEFEQLAVHKATTQIGEAVHQIHTLITDAAKKKTPPELPTIREESLAHSVGSSKELSRQLRHLKDIGFKLRGKLQTLAGRGQDNTAFAKALRIEWNTLITQLRTAKSQHLNVASQMERVSALANHNERTARDTGGYGQRIQKMGRHVSELLHNFLQYSEDGENDIQKAVTQIKQCQDDVERSYSLVQLLSQRAEEIVNIISVIDDIAEQTNLLALNASIEAARAGEQGQGFAVVAEEVRKLAGRSSTATSNIGELLMTIQAEAEQASQRLKGGNLQVTKTSQAVDEFIRNYHAAVSATRSGYGQLRDLIVQAEKLSAGTSECQHSTHEVSKGVKSMVRVFEDVVALNHQVVEHANRLTLSSDRFSRMLNREQLDFNYCFKMLEAEMVGIQKANDEVERLHDHTVALREGYLNSFTASPSGGQDEEWVAHVEKWLAYVRSASAMVAQLGPSSGDGQDSGIENKKSGDLPDVEILPNAG